MSNNKEGKFNVDTCHLFIAVRRNKDNDDVVGKGKACIRRIIRDYNDDLKVIRRQCLSIGGVWRVYHTVNARDMRKALKQFRHTIIDTDSTDICSLWRSELLQQSNRAEKKFMLDIDTKNWELYMEILSWFKTYFDGECQKTKVEQDVEISRYYSPNGYHVVLSKPFNRKLFCESFPDVTVLVDGYYFVEMVRGEEDENHISYT